jgi:tetratricopeptide (TPR) repeat protein
MKQPNKTIPQIKWLPILIGIYFTSSAAFSADSYSSGCANYSVGNFGIAKAHFLAALKSKPTFKAQYQLANTYMQLQDHVNAKKAYASCLALNPPADIKANCVRAISYLTANNLNPPASHASPVVQMYSGSSNRGNQSASAQSAADHSAQTAISTTSVVDFHTKELESRKARIMADAQVEADRIKQSTKQQLEEANAASNRWWVSHEGALHTGCSQEEEAEIRRDGEAKAGKVLEAAHRRVKDLTY